MKKTLIFLLFLFAQMSFGQTGVTHFSVKNGNWSDPYTWNTISVPTSSQSRVWIKDNCTVIVDTVVVVDSVYLGYYAFMYFRDNKSLNGVTHFSTKDANYSPSKSNIKNGLVNDGFTWAGNAPPISADNVLITNYSSVGINSNLVCKKFYVDVYGRYSIDVGKSLNKIKKLKWTN